MGKSKGARIIITLECTCKNLSNTKKRSNGIFRYTSSKNRRNTPNRLELNKFCRLCNSHALFKEIK
uniref:Large ribosomal subunit protein bL33c n=1 Tax=Acrochaetium secundatum TaxID=209631 RepID=A0A4D6BLU4_9FLOR|nr:ribosomal protein L33 [Acrochaetium secundatum]QBX88457.1 ribosomal protein L33 [Acrochaetium secundatum]